MLNTISGDRIRYELKSILQEHCPEKVLHRAEELEVLPKLSPALKNQGGLADNFKRARGISSPDSPPTGLYLALLVYPLTNQETRQLISFLKLSKALTRTSNDTISLKAKLPALADPKLKPSRIYRLLHNYSPQAVTANLISGRESPARRHIQSFLDKLRYVKPALTGNDLHNIGIAPGLRTKELLQRLHDARLDGKVTSKQGEVKLVEWWLAHP
jgi:tRNA nucleotidyltransferase (CCA-adding enzyme)